MIPVILSLFLALSVAPTTIRLLTERPFDLSGYYIPEQSQKNSSNVRWIHLSDHYGTGERGPIYVELRIGNEKRWATFQQTSLTIKGYRIKFETKTHRGVNYEFEGQFSPDQREEELGRFNDSVAASTVLRGMLSTKRGGKVIKSEEITFYYTVGK